MTPQEFSTVCDTIRGSYRDGLTEDQVRGWWKRLQRLNGPLVLQIVNALCERPTPRAPVIGEVMDAYYREMAGRQESEIPTDPEGRLKEIRERYWRNRKPGD